jgi:hypothetical protein
MATVCFVILKRVDGGRRQPADGCRRYAGGCIVRAVSIVLALAVWPAALPNACGQATGMTPGWSTGEPSQPLAGEWSFEEMSGPLSPGIRYAPEPSISRLPPLPDDASAAPRNRALEIVQRSDAYAVRRYRQGFFQRFQFSGGWIDRAGDDGLGISNLDTSLTVAIPLGSFENLLLVTPGFEVDYLNGPAQIDVPAQLYDVGVDFMWRKQFNDRWGSMVAVRPGLASDFQTSQDAVRITGRALATWQWVPERLSLLFGVVYLDRNDLPILPGVGLIWTPNPDWRLDLIFPRPKLARRLVFVPGQREDWVYLGGSLGGRTWAVERSAGVSDQLTLRDYRLYLGWERIVEGGGGLFVEAGYVFGRELEYEVMPATQSFDDAFMIRGGVTY